MTTVAIAVLLASAPAASAHPSGGSSSAVVPGQSWTSCPELEVGGPPGTESTFNAVSSVRVGVSVNGDQRHVYVIEQYRGVSVWDYAGALLLNLGRNRELADFGFPIDIRPDSASYWIRHLEQWTRFSQNGRLMETIPLPEIPVGQSVVMDDGSLLLVERRPPPTVSLGWSGEPPVWDEPVVHAKPDGEGWSRDTLTILDGRHSILGIRSDDGSRTYPTGFFTDQPFADSDLLYLDGARGVAGVVRRNKGPGLVVVTEQLHTGDTIWHRQLSLPAVPLAPDTLEDQLARLAERAFRSASRSRWPTTRDEARRRAEEVLYAPPHLPPVTTVRASSSGWLWLRSSEPGDTLAVWYALPRGDDESPPRRFLLPKWFRLADATDSHAWGVRTDSTGSSRVLGRRLIAPGGGC